MKILIVASFNKGFFAPFILEQSEALEKMGQTVHFFGIQGHGIWGYVRNYKGLKRIIQDYKPDVIHAHYGLSGLLATLQRRVPVVTTFHGSDINNRKVLPFSKIAMRLSAYTIFVSQKNVDIARPTKKFALLPCGVNSDNFRMLSKHNARLQLHLDATKTYVLFAGSFSNRVKNPELAQKAIALLKNVELIELKGYSREEVNYLMHAVDVALMTSHTEGSPQFVKEVMACGCPLVSVDVGDVKEVTAGVEGCYIVSREAEEIAEKLQIALNFKGRTHGRERIMELGLENRKVAETIVAIYKKIVKS
jgi:teichuronic acid biosynthesis glycosyltransferase TuaC